MNTVVNGRGMSGD